MNQSSKKLTPAEKQKAYRERQRENIKSNALGNGNGNEKQS